MNGIVVDEPRWQVHTPIAASQNDMSGHCASVVHRCGIRVGSPAIDAGRGAFPPPWGAAGVPGLLGVCAGAGSPRDVLLAGSGSSTVAVAIDADVDAEALALGDVGSGASRVVRVKKKNAPAPATASTLTSDTASPIANPKPLDRPLGVVLPIGIGATGWLAIGERATGPIELGG